MMGNSSLSSHSERAVQVCHRTIQVRLMHTCPIVSAGLNAILSSQPDISISVDPRDPSGDNAACIVIADYESGLSAARELAQHGNGVSTQLLILTYNVKAGAVRYAIDSGVRGYVVQGCGPSGLLEAVRTLSLGDYYLCPIAGRVAAEWLCRPPLTQREADVLRVLASGGSDKVIARGLGIEVSTVKSHMKQLFHKLGVTTRTQAAIMAMDLGLLAHSGRSVQLTVGASR
jgi:DNA-binding NarL/FixJ family response regulator